MFLQQHAVRRLPFFPPHDEYLFIHWQQLELLRSLELKEGNRASIQSVMSPVAASTTAVNQYKSIIIDNKLFPSCVCSSWETNNMVQVLNSIITCHHPLVAMLFSAPSALLLDKSDIHREQTRVSKIKSLVTGQVGGDWVAWSKDGPYW